MEAYTERVEDSSEAAHGELVARAHSVAHAADGRDGSHLYSYSYPAWNRE
jgi:hypothetical protein